MPPVDSHIHFKEILDFGPVFGAEIGETFTEVGFSWEVDNVFCMQKD